MNWNRSTARIVALIGVLLFPGVTQAQTEADPEPKWHELAPTATERVAVDVQSIELSGSVRRARLRWHLVSIGDRLTTYTIEDTEIDCARQEGRILSRRRVTLEPGARRSEVEAEVSASHKEWHTYGSGSVGRAVWSRMCAITVRVF